MPALDSLQHYVEIGILLVSLLVLVPVGWFTSGYGTKLIGLVMARQASARAVLSSRIIGGMAGAVVAVLLWSGFGGRGVPGPGGPGGTGSERGTQTPASLLDKNLPVATPAQPVPSAPSAITADDTKRQVRVAILGDGTKPAYALDNKFFIFLDGPDRSPLSAEELLKKLHDWKQDYHVGYVLAHYSNGSARPTHSEVEKLRRGVEGLGMKFTPIPVDSGKWVP